VIGPPVIDEIVEAPWTIIKNLAQHTVCRGPASRAGAIRADEAQHHPHQLPNDHGAQLRDPQRLPALAPQIAFSRSSRRLDHRRDIGLGDMPLIVAVEASESGFREKCENPPFPLSGLSLEPGKKNYERKANHRHPGIMRGWYFGRKETD
jgi:hypothetical protein